MYGAIYKLHDYEKTGLEPEEVQGLMECRERIVEQLKEEQEKIDTDIWARETDNWYGHFCNGTSEGLEKAIEIVQKGGAE